MVGCTGGLSSASNSACTRGAIHWSSSPVATQRPLGEWALHAVRREGKGVGRAGGGGALQPA